MDDHAQAVLDAPGEQSGLGRRLGRGLQALLGGQGEGEGDLPQRTVAAPIAANASDAEIRVDAIDPNPFQPRREFEQSAIDDLAGSIGEHGVLQSLLVRPCNGRFQLIAGERRLRAAKQAGLEKVPCRIVDLVDHEVAEAALEENLKRKDLNPLEKARAFQEYLERFQTSIEELAKHLSMKRSTVSNFLRLLELPEPVQQALAADKITNGHARALLSLDGERQVEFCERIRKEEWSVRRTESEVRSVLRPETAEESSSETSGDQQPSNPAETPAESPEPEAPVDNHVASLQDGLRDHFGTTVEIKQTGEETGRFVIHFKSNDEFERLLGMLRAA